MPMGCPQRLKPSSPPPDLLIMNDESSSSPIRYASHTGLAAIGESGQQRIGDSRILLIGLGGLGCPTAQYLVSSGIGKLVLCDFDTVAESNLARQILFRDADIGRGKAVAAAEYLAHLNPSVNIETIGDRIDAAQLKARADEYELIIDASDNYGTRLAVNSACLATGSPWLMGSAIRMEGQLTLFLPGDGSACYRCIYGETPDTLEDCPGAGIFAPVAGMIGVAMAHRALGFLAGLEDSGELQILDGQHGRWQQLKTQKNPNCPACGAGQAQ